MTGRKRMRLTDAGVARLKPGKTEYTVWDAWVAGLGVRVRPSGHRSFVWRGRADGRAARATVGPVATMTVEEAREACLALGHGEGPSAVPLFRDFATVEWKAAAGARWTASRRRYIGRMLENRLLPAFGSLRLDLVRRRDVERWFDAYSMTAPGGANEALAVLRQILGAAEATGRIAANPAAGVRRNARPRFARFLSVEEIGRVHRALDRLVEERPSRRPPADIVRLLLLTGCRRGEIVELKWLEVEGDTLRLADSKTGPRTVWLSEAARTVLAGQPRVGSAYVFPSPRNPAKPRRPCSRFWHLARKEAGIEDVRLHDLRHTVASHAVARGVALSTVAKMLGHASPTMTLRYAHVGDRDTRAAAERIGRAIDAAMAEGSPVECASRGAFGGERAETIAAARGPSGRRDLFRKGG